MVRKARRVDQSLIHDSMESPGLTPTHDDSPHCDGRESRERPLVSGASGNQRCRMFIPPPLLTDSTVDGARSRRWVLEAKDCSELAVRHMARLGIDEARAPYCRVRLQPAGSFFLAALEGEGRVEFVGNDDGDGVELGELFQHLGDIGEDAGDVVFGGGFVSGALVDVAEGDDLSAGLAETVGVISGHAAGADDGDFSAHVFLKVASSG